MTHFLNVDLDVASRQDLAPLIRAMGKSVIVLHSRKDRAGHFVSLELSQVRNATTVDECVTRLTRVIRRLSPAARSSWERAESRRFDVGIQATGDSRQTHSIRATTLKGLSDVRGELVITVYPPLPGGDPSGGRRPTSGASTGRAQR